MEGALAPGGPQKICSQAGGPPPLEEALGLGPLGQGPGCGLLPPGAVVRPGPCRCGRQTGATALQVQEGRGAGEGASLTGPPRVYPALLAVLGSCLGLMGPHTTWPVWDSGCRVPGPSAQLLQGLSTLPALQTRIHTSTPVSSAPLHGLPARMTLPGGSLDACPWMLTGPWTLLCPQPA